MKRLFLLAAAALRLLLLGFAIVWAASWAATPMPQGTPEATLLPYKGGPEMVADLHNDGKIGPSDTVKYTITFSITGEITATNVILVEDYEEDLMARVANITAGGRDSESAITWELGSAFRPQRAELDGSAPVSLFLALARVVGADRSVMSASRSTPLPRGQALIERLKEDTGGKVCIWYHAKAGKVRLLGSDLWYVVSQPVRLAARATPEEAARQFLSTYGQLFGLSDQARELTVMRTKTADRGRSSVRFRQVYQGIPVMGPGCARLLGGAQ